MRYRLSKLIPVPMRSTVSTADGRWHINWLQWRDRPYRIRRHPA